MHNKIKWILILVIISLSKMALSQIFIPTMFWKTKMTLWTIPFATPGNYQLSDSAKLAIQASTLTLIPLDKIDSTQADFDNGLHLGTKWDGSALSLQNPYSTTSQQALAPSWTPEYGNITAYYKFDNSLTPTIGAITPTDVATTNNAAGKFNQARAFNGAARLTFGTAAGFAAMGTADFSISYWVYKSSSGAYGLISTRNDGSCNHAWWTLFADGGNHSALEICSPNSNVVGTIPFNLNAWNFVTVTRSGPNITFYMNGVFDNEGTVPVGFSFVNDDGLEFGRGNAWGAATFTGSLDDVAFWNVALTASQVKALYTGYNEGNRVGNTPQELSSAWAPKWSNLVGYWKMNGNWNDSSGNGINGTAQGTPVFNINALLGSYAGDFYFTSSPLDLVKLPSYSTVANKPTSQMTVSAWVYSTANSNAYETIIGNWGSTTPGAFLLYLDTSSRLHFDITQISGTSLGMFEGMAFPLNRWVHVAGVADGSFMRLYRDGEEVGTPVPYDGTLRTSMDCFALGSKLNDGCITSSNLVYRDKIDDVAFWNTALNAEEIKTIYKAQAPFYSGGEFDSSWTPKYSSLIAYYNLNNAFRSAKGDYPMATTTGTPVISTNSKLGNGSVYLDDASMLGNSSLTTAFSNKSFSISVWSKRSNNAPDYLVGGGGTSGTDASLHFGYRNTNHFTFAFWADDIDTVNAYLDAGDWVHWVGTYNITGRVRKLYRNGVLENSDIADANFIGTGYFCIGGVTASAANCTNVGNGFKGNIDELGIWQAELSAADVQTIYQRQKSQFQGEFVSRVMGTAGTTPTWLTQSWNTPLPFLKELPDTLISETIANYPSVIANLETGLIRLWHMNETTGTTIANATGVVDNLTVTGGTLGEPGAFRNALEVNGTPTYAISSNITTNTSVATLSAWVYLTAYPATGKGHIVGMANSNAASSYDKDLIVDSAGKLIFYTYSGVGHEAASIASIPLNTWTHIAGTVDGANTEAYMNGVKVGTTSSGGGSQATNSVLVGGYTNGYPMGGSRIVDEVALWTRVLSAAEILQLYRRGGIRAKFQVRSCTDIACTGESWRGPDNTSGTYYSELFNYSGQAATPSGTVQATPPTMTFGNFTSLAARPFYQYRTIFETDDSTFVPSVRTVTVTTNPANTYATNDQYANSMAAETFSFKHLFSFKAIEGVCVNTFQISKDGVTFYYFNGTAWAVGDTTTTSQRNIATTIQSNLPAFNSQIMAGGTGNFYLRAFLEGNGINVCFIDNVDIQYD